MARIPTITRLVVEDFPDQKSWIGKLLQPLNQFLSATVFALKGNLTFSDNILSQTFTLDFTYNGSSSLPQKFLVTITSKPTSLLAVQAYENITNPIAVSVAWDYTQQGQVSVTDIVKHSSSGGTTALTTGNRYQIKVIILP